MLLDREVADLLLLEKITVAPVKWQKKHNGCLKYSTSLELVATKKVLVGLNLYCTYMPKISTNDEEKYSFAIVFSKRRIYGVDLPSIMQKHKNTTCVKGDFYNHILSGLHEHKWCEQSDKYAEPVDLGKVTFENVWTFFCKNANISLNILPHPFEDEGGTRPLLF